LSFWQAFLQNHVLLSFFYRISPKNFSSKEQVVLTKQQTVAKKQLDASAKEQVVLKKQ
jgi:hypothetical protein